MGGSDMAAIIFLALGALMLYFAVEIGMRRRIAFLHDIIIRI